MRADGKARRRRRTCKAVRRGGATQPAGMQRRPTIKICRTRDTIKVRTIVLALVLMSAPTVAMANGPLRSIVVFGNEKTERETILDIVGVPPQTYVNPRLIQEVDDRLNNCGLFKKVAVSQVANPDGTADLRIQVVEKQLWFAFPMFQAWSSRYSGGACCRRGRPSQHAIATPSFASLGTLAMTMGAAWQSRQVRLTFAACAIVARGVCLAHTPSTPFP